jgi:hypothetical protein
MLVFLQLILSPVDISLLNITATSCKHAYVSCILYPLCTGERNNTKNRSFGDKINRAKRAIKLQTMMRSEANISQEKEMESKILHCRKRVRPCVAIIQTAAGMSDETKINRSKTKDGISACVRTG